MEERLTFQDIYEKMSIDEKQACDLCEDWGIGDCENCEIALKYNYKEEML